ncbi:MAG TPA: hypothetical protein VFT66_15585 [Roseiflexaceae bacterium]|nr:hypothetical protein [Roseiflexaceae bacterium]
MVIDMQASAGTGTWATSVFPAVFAREGSDAAMARRVAHEMNRTLQEVWDAIRSGPRSVENEHWRFHPHGGGWELEIKASFVACGRRWERGRRSFAGGTSWFSLYTDGGGGA